MALGVRVLAVAVVLALVVVALAWVLQRRLIYLPAGRPVVAPEQVLEGGSAVGLHTEDGRCPHEGTVPRRGP